MSSSQVVSATQNIHAREPVVAPPGQDGARAAETRPAQESLPKGNRAAQMQKCRDGAATQAPCALQLALTEVARCFGGAISRLRFVAGLAGLCTAGCFRRLTGDRLPQRDSEAGGDWRYTPVQLIVEPGA